MTGEKDLFEKKKLDYETGARSSRRQTFSHQGEKILEKKLAVSKDEENYYMNNRVFTNLHKVAGNDSKDEKTTMVA